MKTVPVWHLASLQNGYPFNSADFAASGVLPLLRIRDLTASDFETFLPFDVGAHLSVANGDLVIGMDGDFNATIWKRGRAALNQRLCRLRAIGDNDIRYVAYALPAELTRINATQYATTVKHLSSGEILKCRLPAASPEEQRRVADFLDDRVARIDHIITARRRQSELVLEESESTLESLVTQPCAVRRPLASLTDPSRPIQYGIVLPGPDYPGGVPIIKGGDIGSGRLRRLELNRTDPDIERAYRRSRVRPGDMVIAIRGSVGEVDVVPVELQMANLTQDSARIAPFGYDGEWLRAALVSPGVQSQMTRRITGATVKGINIQDLRRVPIPVPSRAFQASIAMTTKRLREETAWYVDALARSIALLSEYKQSLITAAVSGEFDVSTAGSGIPG